MLIFFFIILTYDVAKLSCFFRGGGGRRGGADALYGEKYNRPPDKRAYLKIICLISQSKTYAVGSQRNHLNEHPKHSFKLMGKKNIDDFTLKHFAYLDICCHKVNMLFWCIIQRPPIGVGLCSLDP